MNENYFIETEGNLEPCNCDACIQARLECICQEEVEDYE